MLPGRRLYIQSPRTGPSSVGGGGGAAAGAGGRTSVAVPPLDAAGACVAGGGGAAIGAFAEITGGAGSTTGAGAGGSRRRSRRQREGRRRRRRCRSANGTWPRGRRRRRWKRSRRGGNRRREHGLGIDQRRTGGRSLGGGAAGIHEGLQLGDFIVFQTGQRGPFAGDACLSAEVHQLLAIDLQIFRERVNPNGQSPPSSCRRGRSQCCEPGRMSLLSHGRVLLYKAPPQPSGATINDYKPSALSPQASSQGYLRLRSNHRERPAKYPLPAPPTKPMPTADDIRRW